MITQKKVIVVFGATGAQGGGLARAILNDPFSEFSVKAVTRNIHFEKANELRKIGAEVVYGNMDDLESLRTVLDDAYGAFLVTPYWSHLSPEREKRQAINMAIAAKDTGVKHAIWSTLEDTRNWFAHIDKKVRTKDDIYKVPSHDVKAEANKYFIHYNVPTTFLITSFYWENLFQRQWGLKVDSKGDITLRLPIGTGKLSGITCEDIGKCAYGIFKAGFSMIYRTIGIAGQHLSGDEMAQLLTNCIGKNVSYNPIHFDDKQWSNFMHSSELKNMFQFYQEFNIVFTSARDISVSKSLNSELLDFESWISQNKSKIRIYRNAQTITI